MEEQIIFFTTPQESLRLLQQSAHSTADHLILLLPENLGRLQAHLLLRLARRQIAGLALSLTVVSGNRQVRLLAEQLGFASAATLDEARGLTPGTAPTRHRTHHPLTPAIFPSLPPLSSSGSSPAPPKSTSPTTSAQIPPASSALIPPTPVGPTADLERLLHEGYLPNPAAIPSLEEEAQRTAREEEAQHSRLSYEIADESTLTLAQQEAEEHEAQIISTILKTSHPLTPPEPPDAQTPHPPQNQTEGTDQPPGTLPTVPTSQTNGPPPHMPRHIDPLPETSCQKP